MTSTCNADQRDAWNGESGQRWVADADRRDRVLAPIAELLLDHAAPVPGERILDIGCGCGATTLAAASAAGSDGSALGIDFSRPMLDVATHRAATAGVDNIDFVHGDAQTHRFGERYDLAISRFGTMFFDDLAAAFANIADGLRPGGRLCLATWQPLEANEWLAVPGAALSGDETLSPGAVSALAMFALADPEAIKAVVGSAGYSAITVEPHTVTFAVGDDVDEAAAYLAATGPSRAILETIPADRHAGALDDLRDALGAHAGDGGVHLDAAVLVTSAERR